MSPPSPPPPPTPTVPAIGPTVHPPLPPSTWEPVAQQASSQPAATLQPLTLSTHSQRPQIDPALGGPSVTASLQPEAIQQPDSASPLPPREDAPASPPAKRKRPVYDRATVARWAQLHANSGWTISAIADKYSVPASTVSSSIHPPVKKHAKIAAEILPTIVRAMKDPAASLKDLQDAIAASHDSVVAPEAIKSLVAEHVHGRLTILSPRLGLPDPIAETAFRQEISHLGRRGTHSVIWISKIQSHITTYNPRGKVPEPTAPLLPPKDTNNEYFITTSFVAMTFGQSVFDEHIFGPLADSAQKEDNGDESVKPVDEKSIYYDLAAYVEEASRLWQEDWPGHSVVIAVDEAIIEAWPKIARFWTKSACVFFTLPPHLQNLSPIHAHAQSIPTIVSRKQAEEIDKGLVVDHIARHWKHVPVAFCDRMWRMWDSFRTRSDPEGSEEQNHAAATLAGLAHHTEDSPQSPEQNAFDQAEEVSSSRSSSLPPFEFAPAPGSLDPSVSQEAASPATLGPRPSPLRRKAAPATPAQSPPAQSPPAQSPPARSPPARSPPARSPPARSPPARSPPARSPPARSPAGRAKPTATTTPPARSSAGRSPPASPAASAAMRKSARALATTGGGRAVAGGRETRSSQATQAKGAKKADELVAATPGKRQKGKQAKKAAEMQPEPGPSRTGAEARRERMARRHGGANDLLTSSAQGVEATEPVSAAAVAVAAVAQAAETETATAATDETATAATDETETAATETAATGTAAATETAATGTAAATAATAETDIVATETAAAAETETENEAAATEHVGKADSPATVKPSEEDVEMTDATDAADAANATANCIEDTIDLTANPVAICPPTIPVPEEAEIEAALSNGPTLNATASDSSSANAPPNHSKPDEQPMAGEGASGKGDGGEGASGNKGRELFFGYPV